MRIVLLGFTRGKAYQTIKRKKEANIVLLLQERELEIDTSVGCNVADELMKPFTRDPKVLNYVTLTQLFE